MVSQITQFYHRSNGVHKQLQGELIHFYRQEKNFYLVHCVLEIDKSILFKVCGQKYFLHNIAHIL